MILSVDSPGRSVNAIYTIWNRKKTKTYFPVILGSMGMSELPQYLNQWLFRTGYIKDWEYSAEYATAQDTDRVDWKKKLDEIFSGE